MDNMAMDSDSNSWRKPPNLPSLDLLTGSGVDYVQIGIPLYEASIMGDWKRAKAIFDKNPHLVRYSLTENGETALHIAVSAYRTKQVEDFIENLVHFMDKEDLTLQNRYYDTAFYLAAAADNIKAVEIMVKKNKALLTISGGGGQIMPLCAAVLFGSSVMVKYLYEKSNKLQDDGWTKMNRDLLLEKCVEFDFFDVAIQILKDRPELASNGNVLRILAGKTDAFCYGVRSIKECKAVQLLEIFWENISIKPKYEIDEILKGPQPAVMQDTKPDSGMVDRSVELQKVISEHFVNLQVETQNIMQQDDNLDSVKKDQAQKLEKIISENLDKMQVKTKEIIRGPAAKNTNSSQVLFIAAEQGNTMFIIELIRRYPALTWSVNDNNQSNFHIAVKNRHVDIYNLLDEIGAMKDMITSLIDDRGNNMLHLAGMSANEKGFDVRGVNYKLYLELLWFKKIENKIHPSYRQHKNKDGLTPHQLFLKEHKDMIATGERVLKEIAGQCMVAASLIATMVFTAAFTVPGAYDQNSGIPIFHSKTTFKIFVVADAISLFSSTISILMFLSVFLSRYGISQLTQSLPAFIIIGLLFLFLSITSMMIAFCLTFFVLYRNGVLWVPVLISGFAFFPFAIYVAVQCVLFVGILRYSCASCNLFKRKRKYFLYYQNPLV